MTTLFVSSFLLGIAFSAPPGAVTAESVRRGFAGGFRSAFLVGMGSLIGDAVWALIALAGIAILVQNATVRLVLGVGGGMFLLWLAWNAFSDAWRGVVPQTREMQAQGAFASGALLSLGNPWAIAFWLGIGSSVIANFVANPIAADYAVFFTAFMLGATTWVFILSGLIAGGRRIMSPPLFRWINGACGVILTYFGLRVMWDTLVE